MSSYTQQKITKQQTQKTSDELIKTLHVNKHNSMIIIKTLDPYLHACSCSVLLPLFVNKPH